MLRFVLLGALAAVAIPAFAQSALTIQVSETAITISNATRGGHVVLFSCSRGTREGRIHVQPTAVMLDDGDGDGVVRVVPAEAVPLRSVYVAVDYASGSIVTGAHPEYPLLVSPIGAEMLRKDAEGDVAQLAQALPRIVLLLVRPGTGAWLLRGRDGEASDRDGSGNGKLLLAFEDATSITGRDKAPKKLKSGDAVAAIDPSHLDVFVGQIGK